MQMKSSWWLALVAGASLVGCAWTPTPARFESDRWPTCALFGLAAAGDEMAHGIETALPENCRIDSELTVHDRDF